MGSAAALARRNRRASADGGEMKRLAHPPPSPLPVRERIKVRVLIQRVFFNARFKILRGLTASSAHSLVSRCAEKLVDCVKYFVHIGKHLIVPESKHSIVARLQKRSANFILLRKLGVLGAIEFDDEASFDRAEVSEVRTNRMLRPEFCVTHPTAAQMPPQQSFSVGFFSPQPPRVPLR
jgi:hypothetical protein